ncbi:MAG: hypothetical protein ACJ74Q_26295 [Pyrinomonadaceae bacterium]
MPEEPPVEETPEETTPPPEEDPLERGGGDGKAKALGTPGLGEYGRPSRRNDAGELVNEVSHQEG